MLETKGTNQYYITRQETTESNARSYPRKFPIAIAKAKGSWVEDVEGNKYLDFLCGAGTLALGHNDPEVNQALVDMINSDAPLHTLDLITPVKAEFVNTVLSLLPKELQDAKIQFCSPSRFLDEIPPQLLDIIGGSSAKGKAGTGYRIGDYIYRDDYGVGVVVKSWIEAGEPVVVVRFESGQYARFLTNYTKLEKISP